MTSQTLPPEKDFWMWKRLQGAPSGLRIWIWWEKRRIPYNLFVIVLSLISIAVYVCSRMMPGLIPPQSKSEDIIPALPIISAAIFGPIIWNACYFIGPLLQIAMFKIKGHNPDDGPRLMKVGLGVSALIVLLPAFFGVIDSFAFLVAHRRLTN